MQIDGALSSISQGTQAKQPATTTQSNFGPSFLESLGGTALRTDVVVREGQMGASGLCSKNMIEDWNASYDLEEEDNLQDIFKKIARVDEILKERFSK
jgi:hypothetical protein